MFNYLIEDLSVHGTIQIESVPSIGVPSFSLPISVAVSFPGSQFSGSSSKWQTKSKNASSLESSVEHKGPLFPLTRTSKPPKLRVERSTWITSKSEFPSIATGITPCPLILKQLGSLPGLMSIATCLILLILNIILSEPFWSDTNKLPCVSNFRPSTLQDRKKIVQFSYYNDLSHF
jgi:hypothetical protein